MLHGEAKGQSFPLAEADIQRIKSLRGDEADANLLTVISDLRPDAQAYRVGNNTLRCSPHVVGPRAVRIVRANPGRFT